MKKSVCLGLLLIPMLLHADYVTEGAKNGLLLWYSSVVPALFPFMVLSGMIVAGGGVSVIMEPFYRILNPLFHLSKNGCYTLVSGLFCGYPMGAKTCADFFRAGQISEAEAKFLMAVSNHPSPMFILGYVYPFFKDQLPLRVFLAAVYGPAFLIAAAAYFVYRPQKQADHSDGQKGGRTSNASVCSVDEAILSAAEVLCKIGGYLMLFSILIVFLKHAKNLPAFPRIILISVMEMTTGIKEAAVDLPYPLSGAVSCAALTFGGFSGVFQTKAVIGVDLEHRKTAGLSIRQYMFWKTLHGILSAGLFCFLTDSLPLFP